MFFANFAEIIDLTKVFQNAIIKTYASHKSSQNAALVMSHKNPRISPFLNCACVFCAEILFNHSIRKTKEINAERLSAGR